MTIERWTEKETEDNASTWEDSSSGKARAGQQIREGWPEDPVSLTKEAGLRAGWGGARGWGRAHGEPRTNDGGLESRGPGNDLRVGLEREL